MIPEQVTLSRAEEAFSRDGSFADPRNLKAVTAVTSRLVEVTLKMVS